MTALLAAENAEGTTFVERLPVEGKPAFMILAFFLPPKAGYRRTTMA